MQIPILSAAWTALLAAIEAAAANADTAATTATTKAGEAAASATTATGAATTASTAATTASGAATTATTAAGEASDSASDAAASAGDANTSRETAEDAASTATTAATTATGAATTATGAATTATTASTSATRAAERAGRTAARLAGALGASGDARNRYGSADDVWGDLDHLDESTAGPCTTDDTGDGPFVTSDIEAEGDLCTAFWEMAVAGADGGDPLADAGAFTFVAESGSLPGTGADHVGSLALVVELLDGEGETMYQQDALTFNVAGFAGQTVAAEGVPLVYGQGETRAERIRVTVSFRPYGSHVVTIAAYAAPMVRVVAPEIGELSLSRAPRLADVLSRGAGTVSGVTTSGQDWFINAAGTLTLPETVTDRTKVYLWHDIAAGGTIAFAVDGGGTLYNAGGSLTTRGQRRTAVFRNGAWYLA